MKVYVSDAATDDQAEAVVELMKLEPTFGMLFSGDTKILTQERAPVSDGLLCTLSGDES